jgi:hypothetical protein
MTPLESVAKAIAKEDWGYGRAGGPWSDEIWDRLLKGYREIDSSDETDFVKAIYREAHYLDGIFRKARAALMALADVPENSFPEGTLDIAEHVPTKDFRDILRGIAKSE